MPAQLKDAKGVNINKSFWKQFPSQSLDLYKTDKNEHNYSQEWDNNLNNQTSELS